MTKIQHANTKNKLNAAEQHFYKSIRAIFENEIYAKATRCKRRDSFPFKKASLMLNGIAYWYTKIDSNFKDQLNGQNICFTLLKHEDEFDGYISIFVSSVKK